jgi:hypothetical protein
MRPPRDDGELAAAFRALRREEEEQAPPFADVVRRGRSHSPRAGRFLAARPLGLAAALALAVMGVWIGLRARVPRPFVTAPSLAEWRSPTQFLLETPGREVLSAPAGWGRSVLDLRDVRIVPPVSRSERRSPS